MDEHESPQIKIISAPYIADPQRLILAAADAEHRVFYRSGSDGFTGRAIDFFSAGSFPVHEMSWVGEQGIFDGRVSSDRLDALDCSDGVLAGYMSYEAGFTFELKKWGALQLPGLGYAWRFFQLPCWYEVNHTTGKGRICAVPHAEHEAVDYLRKVVAGTAASNSVTTQPLSRLLTVDQIATLGEVSEADYQNTILMILDDIRSGRYYELNLTQRFRRQSTACPSDVFVRCFGQLAPRRGFFCDFQDEVIMSVSPELFLKKSGTRLSTRPIKGSITGLPSVTERKKLRAEHVMVVDLARNDLGRVSDSGWVAVEEFESEREFGGLSHLESLVTGSTTLGWQKILSRTFPAASITGMPKVIVVQSIANYEKSTRGVYTGACGWVWPGGNFDFNVAIRTFTAKPTSEGWEYELGAGGAITADSLPSAEYLECLTKARPLLSNLYCE